MHKIESSLSTRAGAADPRRGVLAWLRNRAAVPALSEEEQQSYDRQLLTYRRKVRELEDDRRQRLRR